MATMLPPARSVSPGACRAAGWAAVLSALVASGCANWQVPRIDPSGERIFLPPGAAPQPTFVPRGPYSVAPPVVAPPVYSQSGPVTAAPRIASPSTAAPTPANSPAVASAARVSVRVSGPAQAAVGSTATFRIEVTNPSQAAASNVLLTDQVPSGLSFLNSSPAANSSPNGQQWRLGTIGRGQTMLVEANFRVTAAGSLEYCATATAGNGSAAKGCATTNAAAPSKSAAATLSIEVVGPQTAAVGDEVQTVFRIINRGEQPATGLVLKDRFDEGLRHATLASPIESDLPELPAGGSRRVSVTLRVVRPGRWCQDVEVTGEGGLTATARHCIAATPAASSAPVVTQPVTPPANQPATRPSTQPATPPAVPGKPAMTMTINGPTRRAVGETAEFVIIVTNAGGETLRNVKISDSWESPLLEVEQATEGFKTVSDALEWTIATIEPGQSRKRRIVCRCKQPISRACNRVVVTADPNLRVADGACLEITGAATAPAAAPPAATPPRAPSPAATAPALAGLTVSVVDQKDPLRVGQENIYQVTVTNRAASSRRNVKLKVDVSERLAIKRVEAVLGVSLTDRTATFATINEVRAGEAISFNVHAQAIDRGTATVRAELTSDGSTGPVRAEETTEVLAQ